MSVKEIDCAQVDECDLVALYLGGKLPEAEAEAFEAHYFGCERCSGELKAAAQIRVAKGVDVFAARWAGKRRAKRVTWTLLAAAAAVAVMVFGLQRLSRRPEISQSEPVWRGSSVQTISLEISPSPTGQLVLRWRAHPEAQVYVVEIFASDGASVWRQETSEATVSIPVGVLPPSKPGVSFFATVEALDSMHQVIAKSARETVPRP